MIIHAQKLIQIRKLPTLYREARHILTEATNFTEAVASVASFVERYGAGF